MYIQTSMLPHSISHVKWYWGEVIVPLQLFYPHEPASIAIYKSEQEQFEV